MLVTSVCIANKVTCKCVYVYCTVCPSCSLQRRGVWSRGREGRRRQHPGQVLRVLQRFLLQHRGKWLPHSSVSLSLEHNDLVYSTQWWALDRRNLRWVSCWCLSSSAHVRMRLGYVIPLTPPLLLFLTSPLSSRAPECADAVFFYPQCNFVGLLHFSVVLRMYVLCQRKFIGVLVGLLSVLIFRHYSASQDSKTNSLVLIIISLSYFPFSLPSQKVYPLHTHLSSTSFPLLHLLPYSLAFALTHSYPFSSLLSLSLCHCRFRLVVGLSVTVFGLIALFVIILACCCCCGCIACLDCCCF